MFTVGFVRNTESIQKVSFIFLLLLMGVVPIEVVQRPDGAIYRTLASISASPSLIEINQVIVNVLSLRRQALTASLRALPLGYKGNDGSYQTATFPLGILLLSIYPLCVSNRPLNAD